MESNILPKKLTTNNEYALAAQEFIKAKRDEAGGAKPFFKLVYGREPVGTESITFPPFPLSASRRLSTCGLMCLTFGMANSL